MNFSLPTQRCFCSGRASAPGLRLFSAYAEVFPSLKPGVPFFMAFLCLRRGVSTAGASSGPCALFSLPTQRCFPCASAWRSSGKLFSAYAEVFLQPHDEPEKRKAFLCLRRGVS